MLSEDQARGLLHLAADTIEVQQRAVPAPSPPRWTGPIALVAVIILIAGLAALTWPGPAEQHAAPLAPPGPVERAHRYAEDEVPALLGLTAQEAREAVSGRGWHVQVREASDVHCLSEPLVLHSRPGQGTRLQPGDTLTLTVTKSLEPWDDCVGGEEAARVWSFVRFARGLEPVRHSGRLGDGAPRFSEKVTLFAGDLPPRTIPRDRAGDRDSWVLCHPQGACHSALAALVEQLTKRWPVGGTFGSPSVTGAQRTGPACPRTDVPEPVRGWTMAPLAIAVKVPTADDGNCPPVIELHYDRRGEISAVGLRLHRSSSSAG